MELPVSSLLVSQIKKYGLDVYLTRRNTDTFNTFNFQKLLNVSWAQSPQKVTQFSYQVSHDYSNCGLGSWHNFAVSYHCQKEKYLKTIATMIFLTTDYLYGHSKHFLYTLAKNHQLYEKSILETMGAEKIHEFINYNSENEIEIYLCDMRKLNEIVTEWMYKDSIPVIDFKSWKA